MRRRDIIVALHAVILLTSFLISISKSSEASIRNKETIGNTKVLTEWSEDTKLSITSVTKKLNPMVRSSGNCVYAVWREVYYDSEIVFTKSNDFGKNWEKSYILTPPLDIEIRSAYFPDFAAVENNLYVVWQDERQAYPWEIYFKNSSDNGQTWSNDTALTSNDGYSSEKPNIFVVNNSIYVVWEDTRHGNCEIYFKKGLVQENGTIAWESEKRVTTTSINTGNWNPCIHITNATIHLVFHRYLEDTGKTEIFYMNSTDNGGNWSSPQLLSTKDAHNSYVAQIVANNDILHIVWQDDYYGVVYRNSPNSGNTWNDPVYVVPSKGIDPQIVMSENKTLYITYWTSWEEYYKSYYIISYDNGYSWQGPYLLSDKSASSPQLAISNGYIHAVFTSDRAGTSEIYYKRSPPFSTEPANITITANPTILTADGVSNATLTIWVYNYTGSPLPNQNVTLSTNGFGSVSNVTDNGDGSYTANYTAGTVAGNVIITATAGFVSNNTTIVLKPGAIARIEIHPPGPVTYNKTETCYYTAAGYDIYQNINTTWLPVWKVDGGVGIINETGFFTATKKGTGAVNCTDNITGIYNVSIINVLNSNPIIELIENRTAYEGQMFTLQINATDLDGDTLLFSDNSTLFDINSTTGLISFTPSYDSAGIYCVNITVTDGEALVWQNFKLEIINVNRKPVAIISLPSNNSKFSTTDEINFNASASYDPDNDNLTYVWRSNIQGLLSNAKSFSAKLSAGVHTITLTVSDGTLSDSKQITITVETPLQPSWRLTPIEGAIVTSIICVAMAVIIILRKLKRIP